MTTMRASEHLCLFLNRFFPRRQRQGRESPEAYSLAQHEWASKSYAFYADVVDLKGKEVLDAGCGPGGKTLYYAALGCSRIIGVDIDENRIGHASAFLRSKPTPNAEFLKADLSCMPFPDNSFDVIFLNDVFEHIERPLLSKVLLECRRVIRPGGQICMEFPPWTSYDAGHLYDHIHIPWCQNIFSERTLVNVIKHMEVSQPIIGRLSVVEHFLELNRITIREARTLFEQHAFSIRRFEQVMLKNVRAFRWIPVLNAYLTRRVVVILSK
jgi:ubiquinone/menaquinone biosynthesis C-methylase UbiE